MLCEGREEKVERDHAASARRIQNRQNIRSTSTAGDTLKRGEVKGERGEEGLES